MPGVRRLPKVGLGRAALSGFRVPHLQHRHGSYHLRVRVPDDLKLRVGMVEVRRSLRTSSLSVAHRLAARYAARLKEVFEMLRTESYTLERARAFVAACFHDIVDKPTQPFVSRTDWPDLEIAEQRGLAGEHLSELEDEIATGNLAPQRQTWVTALLRQHGIEPASLPNNVAHDLSLGMLRVQAEQDRLFMFRLGDRLAPYVPTDSLFIEQARAPASPVAPTPRAELLPTGPRLGDLVDAYLAQGRRKWTAKTLKSNTAKLAVMLDHFGRDRFAETITAQDVRGYRDAVRRLHRNYRLGIGKTMRERQTDTESHQLSAKTASLIFESCKAFFRWAKADAYITANPATDIRVEVGKTSKRKAPTRRPFTPEELKVLFEAPNFTGFKSPGRRFEPGSLVVRNAYYWVPLIGLYTGMRLGEIIQLHMGDLHLDGPHPYIDVSEDADPKADTADVKHVKSDAGIRRVPVHPDMIKLGFREFVRGRQKDRRTRTRLFWEVGYGADGQPSSIFSKWFGRLLGKVGLTDPALVFHSFRHGMEDAFRNALVPQYVIDRIIGHADGAVSSKYGQGVSLEVAYRAVADLRIGFDAVSLLASQAHRGSDGGPTMAPPPPEYQH